jgi:Sec-independent protein translocase protein TatA
MRRPVKYPELVRVFKEASRNFKSNFRDIEDENKFKTIGTYTESTYFIFKVFKKNY